MTPSDEQIREWLNKWLKATPDGDPRRSALRWAEGKNVPVLAGILVENWASAEIRLMEARRLLALPTRGDEAYGNGIEIDHWLAHQEPPGTCSTCSTPTMKET